MSHKCTAPAILARLTEDLYTRRSSRARVSLTKNTLPLQLLLCYGLFIFTETSSGPDYLVRASLVQKGIALSYSFLHSQEFPISCNQLVIGVMDLYHPDNCPWMYFVLYIF